MHKLSADWGCMPSKELFDFRLPPLLTPAVRMRLRVGEALVSWISTSDTGYVHFRLSLSLAPKSSEAFGATDTQTTRSFSRRSLRFLALVIIPFWLNS